MLKDSSVTCFTALPQHLPGRNEGNHQISYFRSLGPWNETVTLVFYNADHYTTFSQAVMDTASMRLQRLCIEHPLSNFPVITEH
jgi:hypothetical protein